MPELLKRQVYAGLMEIVKDDRYYYKSKVDQSYNRITEDGREALARYLAIMAPHMIRELEEDLMMMAKQMVIEELKK